MIIPIQWIIYYTCSSNFQCNSPSSNKKSWPAPLEFAEITRAFKNFDRWNLQHLNHAGRQLVHHAPSPEHNLSSMVDPTMPGIKNRWFNNPSSIFNYPITFSPSHPWHLLHIWHHLLLRNKQTQSLLIYQYPYRTLSSLNHKHQYSWNYFRFLKKLSKLIVSIIFCHGNL